MNEQDRKLFLISLAEGKTADSDKAEPDSAEDLIRYGLDLDDEEWDILSALAEIRSDASLEEMTFLTGLEPDQLRDKLDRLAAKGIICRQGPEGVPQQISEFHSSIKGQDHYQVLGVEPGSDSEQIRAAYVGLIRQYHPNRYKGPQNDKTRQVLKEIFINVTRAYDTLSDIERRKEYQKSIEEIAAKSKEEYDSLLAPLFGEQAPEENIADQKQSTAQQFYESALEDFRIGDYQSSNMNFKLAAAMDPECSDYSEGLKKTQAILDKQQAEELRKRAARLDKKGKFHAALGVYGRVAELMPEDPEPRYNMARMGYENDADLGQALESINAALDLDPLNIEFMLLLAKIRARLGHIDQAVRTCRKILAIERECREAREILDLLTGSNAT